MKSKKQKRLIPRIYSYGEKNKLPYVLFEDIEKFHGKKWSKKFGDLIYGSTGMIVPSNDPSHGKNKEQFAIYEWDYQRFADVIDFKKPTYFD